MAASFDFQKCWSLVQEQLRRKSQVTNTTDVSTDEIKNALSLLSSGGLSTAIFWSYFKDEFSEDLQDLIIPEFWLPFKEEQENAFSTSVETLHNRLLAYNDSLNLLEESSRSLGEKINGRQELNNILKALLLFHVPSSFHNQVISFYSSAFKAFHAKNSFIKGEDDLEDEDMLVCSGCDQDKENCCCQKVLQTLELVNKYLKELGLLESLVGDAVLTVAHTHIEEYVQENCKGNFDKFYKATLEEWLQKTVISWIYSVLGKEGAHLETQLSYFLHEMYATVRMEQLFNIIIEFPESQAALEDLRDCLEKTNLRSKLITSLKKSLETRLLHPGVNTSDILTAYISGIKALRILDPTGVILQLVSQPVCRYLRSREDTVRCIVSSLIDDSCSELTSELLRGAPLVLDDCHLSDEENDDWENWQPDPVDADPAKAPKSHRSSDIISMLVNIYGTKGLFVEEYQTLLADRLLSGFCYDTEREIRYLELLKLRFGEGLLHFCEVMLKDVGDSKRINAHIASELASRKDPVEFPLNAMIVSAQFWPNFREEKLKLPPCIQEAFEKFTTSFEALKGNRTLSWKPSLGLVDIEVVLKDRTLNVSVSPMHATIIWHFQEKATWSVDELSQTMQASASAVRRKITFWQGHGVLREEKPDVFLLVEEGSGSSLAGQTGLLHHLGEGPGEEEEDMEASSIATSSKVQQEEELQMFWSFIVGMLTNLESLPLEQIHTMLHMFAMQGPNATEWSIHELRQFLSKKVCEEKLLFSNGMYRLPT